MHPRPSPPLQVYAALPSAAAYASEQEALTNLCVRAIKAAASGNAPALARGALLGRLQPADAVLGPDPQARDPLEAALLAFEGVPGGPAVYPWQAGLREDIGYAMADSSSMLAGGRSSLHASRASDGDEARGIISSFAPYPQPKGLGAALLEAQVQLLGRLLSAVAPANQALIADALLSIAGVATDTGSGRRERDPARRAAAVAVTAAAALAGVATLRRGGGGSGQAQEAASALAPRLKALGDQALEDNGGDPALQRAAADLYAAAAALSADASALALIRALCVESAETAVLSRRAALALAVGSASRAVGGLSLQAVLPLAEETLVAVAGASDRRIAPWVLQALLGLAEAAGLAYVPHVRRTLALAQVRVSACCHCCCDVEVHHAANLDTLFSHQLTAICSIMHLLCPPCTRPPPGAASERGHLQPARASAWGGPSGQRHGCRAGARL